MATQYTHPTRPPLYAGPPPGWAPPYQGAPPPMPAGIMVNAQQWQMGSWQFNPAYNFHRYPAPPVQWMPAPSWGHAGRQQHQQQQAGFNPYKKVIKPPSAEYLATKLTDNGLDLHNMVPIPNPYGDEEDANTPKTPWIWNPATLSNDAVSVSAQRAENATGGDRSQIRHSSEPPPSDTSHSVSTKPRHATDPVNGWNASEHRRNSTSTASSSTSHSASSSSTNLSGSTLADSSTFSAVRELRPTFSPKIIRIPAHYANRSSPSSASSSHTQSQEFVDSLSGRMDRMNISELSHDPSALTRHSSMPSVHSNAREPTSSISGVPLVDEPASILSPLIIASTPRPSNARPLGRGSTYPELGGQSTLTTIAESSAPVDSTPRRKSFRRNTPPDVYARSASPSRDSFRRQSSHRTDSYPRSASPSQENFRRGSTSQHTPPDTHAQEIPRHSSTQQHTPPDAYPAHQQTSPSREVPRRLIDIYAPPPTPPSHSTPRRSNSHHRTSESYSSSGPRPPSREPSPPRSASRFTPPRDPNHLTPPSNTNQNASYTYNHNPLPEPPRSPGFTPPRAANHPAPPVSPRTYEEPRPQPIKLVNKYTPMPPPPGAVKRCRRVGYWNRRGDHVTKEGYIVYAPPDQAFPEELKDYPEDGVAYENGFGHIGLFDPKRPELPESLPRHGQPPERPYSSFVKYEWC
ncbi:hypothetical protein LshimejAT787_0604500 [Lyophyllum shimeji]|uniref:Uncharacterized protein n=1 Tax=Lyophyllum shimeji TaxID=47721 RepID=A0A9P3PPP1_LYOSH|nr:hypothetical protein LshimejAT787_0604500 [Lyophyllum shimeji]